MVCVRSAENFLIEWNKVFLWIICSQPDKYIIAGDKQKGYRWNLKHFEMNRNSKIFLWQREEREGNKSLFFRVSLQNQHRVYLGNWSSKFVLFLNNSNITWCFRIKWVLFVQRYAEIHKYLFMLRVPWWYYHKL